LPSWSKPVTLQTRLTKLNIRHKDLAFITGRTERAVHLWVHGLRPLPRSTEILLQALESGRIDEQWLAGVLSSYIAKPAKHKNAKDSDT
jgi:hypothetical protein